jgi:methyl-accepting chemotaxis protein
VSLRAHIENLAIRTKILASFAAILLLLGGLGTIAVVRFGAMSGSVDDITSNAMSGLVDLDAMRVSFGGFRRAVTAELLFADDKAARHAAQAKLAAFVKAYQEADAKYQPLVDPGAEAKLYAEITSTSASYMTTNDHLTQLLDADKLAEAKDYLLKEMIPAGDRFDAALKADMDLNAAQTDTEGAEITQQAAAGRLYVLGFVALAVLVAILAAVFLIGTIARPIQAMTRAMHRLAARDMAADIPAQGRRDEVGQMATAVQVFKDGMLTADRLAAEQATDRAQKEQRAARLERAVGKFETTARELVGLLSSGATELEATARAMTGTADRTNQQAGAVATAAEEAGAGVQTVASAADELTASISEISRQVAQSAKMAARAVEDAQRTNTLVATLADGADKIGAVVGLITSIAG